LFELANKGTLFLDEIAELPMDVQSKLLRVLENGEVKRLGSVENPKCVDVRIIAATNKDLQKMVDEKLFREDLFYRINVIPVTLPPLRERVEEIPLFANMFLEVFNKKYGQTKCFSQKLMKNLVEYQWPGNVRELKNIIERLSLTSKSDILDYEDGLINNEIKNEGLKEEKEMKTYFSDTFDKSNTLQEVMSEYEEMYIKHILEQCEGNVANASKKMGIHRSVLYRKLKKISEVD
jgi:transcriptional regulator with PAS, ATPase and Fis domain